MPTAITSSQLTSLYTLGMSHPLFRQPTSLPTNKLPNICLLHEGTPTKPTGFRSFHLHLEFKGLSIKNLRALPALKCYSQFNRIAENNSHSKENILLQSLSLLRSLSLSSVGFWNHIQQQILAGLIWSHWCVWVSSASLTVNKSKDKSVCWPDSTEWKAQWQKGNSILSFTQQTPAEPLPREGKQGVRQTLSLPFWSGGRHTRDYTTAALGDNSAEGHSKLCWVLKQLRDDEWRDKTDRYTQSNSTHVRQSWTERNGMQMPMAPGKQEEEAWFCRLRQGIPLEGHQGLRWMERQGKDARL